MDLATELIARNGLKLGIDIDIQITGIRPGEKLYEELSCDNEQVVPTSHDKIHIWQLPPADPVQVQEAIRSLSSVIYLDRDAAIETLMRCVPEYQPGEKNLHSVAAALRAA
jgi:FlaA1/EpsC-like NDP-sugar epimerase